MFKRIGKLKYDFIENELTNSIQHKISQIKAKIQFGEIKENLNHGLLENIEKTRIGLLGEELFKTFIGGKINDDILGEYDIMLDNGLKIDIKTIKTNKPLSSSTLNKYSFYLQENQVKEDVLYCPIFINENTKEFAIYFNYPKMYGLQIKKDFKAVNQNPPFTRANNLIKNYVIPYLRIYS